MSRAAGSIATLFLLVVGSALDLGAAERHHTVTQRIRIGGEGGWDYLAIDTAASRLYVSHGTQVEVVDVARGTVVGVIPNTPGVHAVAVAPEAGRGFTTNSDDSSVTVFALKTLAPLDRIKLRADGLDGMAYDPVSGRVFAFSAGSATAIDARSNRIVGNVALAGKPESAVPDGAGRMYVNLEDTGELLAFDTRTLKVLSRWPVAPGKEPAGLAIDTERHRLFAGCGNQKLVVLDASSGRVVSALPIGAGCDGTAFDSKRRLVFTTNGADSSLTVIHEDSPDHYAVVENVETQRKAKNIALDERSGAVYTVSARYGPRPAPTPDNPQPHRPMLPGSFEVLVVRQ
jgi:outer membrane protein assembly factor BamB